MSIIIGIDPGQDGAIAVIAPSGVCLYDIGGSMHDGIEPLMKWAGLVAVRGGGAVIEKVGAMPHQGVVSMFKFGMTYGHLRGALIALGIPIIAEPTPPTWRKAIFGAIPKQKRDVLKRMSRDKARELYPQVADQLSRVKDADRAEALLLGEYGRRVMLGGTKLGRAGAQGGQGGVGDAGGLRYSAYCQTLGGCLRGNFAPGDLGW